DEEVFVLDHSITLNSLLGRLGRWKWPTIIGLALALVFISVRVYNNLFRAPKENTDKAVLTVAAKTVDKLGIQRHLKLTGTIWAWDPLTIGAEVGGLRIETVNVEEGDVVEKGQVLATLNSSLIRAQLERERAHLNRAQINLDKTKQPNRPMDIARLRAALAQASAEISQEESSIVRAKANLRNARNNTSRYKALRTEGAVSVEDLDTRMTVEQTSEADLHNAEQRLQAAKFVHQQAEERLKLAMEGGMREDIDMARADIAEITASIKHHEAQLAQTIIKAPSHGLIVKRLAHIGDISVANEDLFQMVRDNRFEVRAQVPEKDLSLLKPGQVTVFTGAAGSSEITGKIREISPLVSNETRLATIRIDIPYEKGWLPGMFLHGMVDLGKTEVLVVPQSSVLDRDGRKIVFVLEKNRVFSKIVKLGERSGDNVEIVSGLEQGVRVAGQGAGFLKDGDIVRVVEK
ncbi:MAG: efflux RND transporter periplasmic adaptor subunit, partial [Cyanobacteria bacterium]|nr:efflux RND transporter periplasmic adaptor subunit [Cyanobacteriota bacterium]